MLNTSEYLTSQFYQWEIRGRGWIVAKQPVQLEPPFVPFVRYFPAPKYVDDGKRHTWVSEAIDYVKGNPTPSFDADRVELNYEEIEPYVFNDESEVKAIQVKFPLDRNITVESMKGFLTMLSYIESPISFEVIGTSDEICIQLVCRSHDYSIVSGNIKSYFPEAFVIETSPFLHGILKEKSVAIIDFGLHEEFLRPLNYVKSLAIDPLTGFYSALQELKGNEHGGIQILFNGVLNSWTDSIINASTLEDGTSFFADAPDTPKLAMDKVLSPLFAVAIRVFGQGETHEEAELVMRNIALPFLMAAQGINNSLIPLITDDYDVTMRIRDICRRESHRLGMLLNVDELISVLHFPGKSVNVPKLNQSTRKTKSVPPIALGKEFTLGLNSHNGLTTPVTVSIEARLKHTHIIGATGTGKSTLIATMVLQDIIDGRGITLLDPHGDLIEDVIARIPENRLNDVVLIDPTDSEYPIGLNILKAHNDIEKEVLSSDLVASFRRFSTSWGDQMNAVLGNVIIAILESSIGGTLHNIRRFLIEKEFRNDFLKTVSDPSVLYYWNKEYPFLKTNSIGPILTRLDAFLRPKIIRNMVIQNEGIDFESLINSDKIILVKLSQGLIGTENSYLLGSLILSKIHQASFARQQKSHRNPHFIYIDEFQNFITPSIQQMLSGIRKYNVGLILSHQDLQQLQREDGELVNSVLGNAYTRIVFRVGENDAKRLQDGFSSFESSDLQNLGRGEALLRIEQPKFDCSFETMPLQEVDLETRNQKLSLILVNSRKEYGRHRDEVEQILVGDIKNEIPKQEHLDVQPEINVPKEDVQREEVIEEIPKPDAGEVENTSTHRYLQTLVKKMAESYGYVAIIEAQTPDGQGSVDIVLTKDSVKIAVEISVSTDAEWEVHNISKCIKAGYVHIVSVSGDLKQLEKIKQKCILMALDISLLTLEFLTPDALFEMLATRSSPQSSEPAKMKGYRVNVSYDNVSKEENARKKNVIAQAVLKALKKKGKS